MRSDRLLTLIRAHVAGDRAQFRDTALGLAAAEARLWKGSFGQEVRRLLGEAGPAAMTPLPEGRDKDPLLEIRAAMLGLADLVTTPAVTSALAGIVEEHRYAAVLAKHGLAPPRKILLAGPPGTGKTSAAGGLAAALGVPLVVARHEQVVTSFLGDSAKNLSKVFAFAGANPCVLLLDEFDSFGMARGGGGDAASSEIHRLLNVLLQFMDRHSGPGLVVAATNLPAALDGALPRRFDAAIHFAMPSEEQRRELIQRTLGEADDDGAYTGSHAEIVRECLREKKRRILTFARKGAA